MKFRSKAFEIEAFQWFKNGDHPLDRVGEILSDPLGGPDYERQEGALVRYFRHPEFPGNSACQDCNQLYHDHGYIDTAQGGHKVCPGDWIIPESHSPGKFYPCKPDVFAAKYEPANAVKIERKTLESDSAARDTEFSGVISLLMLRHGALMGARADNPHRAIYEKARDSAVAELEWRYAEALRGRPIGDGLKYLVRALGSIATAIDLDYELPEGDDVESYVKKAFGVPSEERAA